MPFENKIAGCPVACGLIFHIQEEPVPVPLKNVKIDAKIIDFVADVTVEQRYVNEEKNPIEAVYMFPVEEESAVINFTAEVDGRTITTQVKKKEEARAEYDKAMQEHQTAVLLEETTPDIFRIKLGQLKPGAGAKIRLNYISELPVENKSVRLTVPTTIAPRYVPPSDQTEAAKIISAIPYSFNSPAPLKVNLEVVASSKIESISSPSHKLLTVIDSTANSNGQFEAKSKLEAETCDLDRDIVVLISSSDPHKPTVFVEKSAEHDTSIAGMVSLVPSFSLTDQKVELIFLVDRSGSMGAGYNYQLNEPTEGSIGAARKALNLFLHSLPTDCYFNIYSFGSHFDSLFDGSVKYDDDSLAKAKQHVSTMDANYGGTEIFQPLDAIFKQLPKAGHLRQIFVLTDGEVSNSSAVVELVKRNSSKGRVFALGLGASASRHLVKGIARSGGGIAVFAAEGEDLRAKVMSQLKNAMQPSLSDVTVVWNGVNSDVETSSEPQLEMKPTLLGYKKPKSESNPNSKLSAFAQAPGRIPPIYDGTRLLVYRLFEPKSGTPNSVTITAQTPDGPLSVEIPVGEKTFLTGNFVHQLAARKRIQDLEEMIIDESEGHVTKQDVENAVVELGVKFRLASKHTSFVGVDDKKPSDNFEPVMNTRDIKNQVPSGFGFGAAMAYCSKARGFAPQVQFCSMPMPMMFGGGMGGHAPAPSSASYKRSARLVPMSQPQVCEIAVCQEMADSCDSVEMREPEEAPLERKERKAEDKLTSLIDLQSSDGHFRWGDAISSHSGKSKDELMSKRPDFVINEDVWITAVVVAMLEAMKEEEELWELVVSKAKKFLAKLFSNDQMDSLMSVAEKLI